MSSVTVKVALPASLDTSRREVRVAVNHGMHLLGTMARDYWHSLVNAELNTSYVAYRNAMELRYTMAPSGIDRAEISISGFVPMAVEFGTEKFDMKSRLYQKGVDSEVIPFRHGISSTARHRRMHIPPADITKLMKRRKIGTVLTNTPLKYKLANRITGVPWHSARYERLTKYATGWHTFRTMSKKSSGLWIHPGFRARLFHERVIDHVHNVLVGRIFQPLVQLLSS